MAGRPRTRAVLDSLTRRANDQDITALEYVTQHLAGGGLIVKLCDELALELKHDVSYGMFVKALKIEAGDEEVTKALATARREGAHAKVEEAQQIADDVAADKDMIARAKLQAEMRLWAAERNNRDAFGTVKAAGVTINIAELHIDSLRRMQANDEAARVRQLSEGTPVEAEVLSIEAAADEIDALL